MRTIFFGVLLDRSFAIQNDINVVGDCIEYAVCEKEKIAIDWTNASAIIQELFIIGKFEKKNKNKCRKSF